MKIFKSVVLAAFLGLALIPMAQSSDNVWSMAESSEYGQKTWGMLGRGLLNAASCFVDLVVQTVEKTQEGPAFVGTMTGLGSGAACTVLRAGSGIVDIAAFWVPDFNGLPVARSYSDCLLPHNADSPYSGTVPEGTQAQTTAREAHEAAAGTEKDDALKYVK